MPKYSVITRLTGFTFLKSHFFIVVNPTFWKVMKVFLERNLIICTGLLVAGLQNNSFLSNFYKNYNRNKIEQK